MTECDQLKQRALEAARKEDADREASYQESLTRQDNEAYAQLKKALPLLTRDRKGLEMCGYRFTSTMMGWTSDGQYAHALQPVGGWYGDFIYDEASFGRFLLREERDKAKPKSTGFWANLFS